MNATRLIDTHRYRDIVFPRMPSAWSAVEWPPSPPKASAGTVEYITAREIRLDAIGGHVAFVRAFEIRGSILSGLRTTVLQFAMVWAMPPPIDPDDRRTVQMGLLYQGHGESPQTILEFSQSATARYSPWRWVVSAPRDKDNPIPLGSLNVIPAVYLGDRETYPDAPAAFDALMKRVLDGWSGEKPWLRR